MLRNTSMNKRRLPVSRRVTLGAMVAALTILCLYAATVLPYGRIAMYFLSSLIVYVLACEGAYGAAFLSYLASSAIAFVFLPGKFAFLAYAFFLGHYGIFRTAISTRMQSKTFSMLVKLLYCDFFAGAALYIARMVLGEIPFIIPQWLPVWALVLLVQVAFIVFDLLYSFSVLIYESRLRRSIVPRR